MIILGFFLLCGFAFWERIYKFPLLNPSVWRNRNYTLCVVCVLFGYMSFITNQFWISLYMQQVQGLAPLTIAIRMLPQAIAGIFWSFVGQALVHRLSGTILMGIGATAYLIGATLQIFIRQHTSYWKLLFPSLLVTVLGADFQFIVSNVRSFYFIFYDHFPTLSI
jgi:nitrate/nitrite transporter NarK